ncbi:regulatory protein RecX [Pseudomaricurvus sp. HS19]|uniref:regulatory protein RecX n=1 Tax=Pseudomaricurvus sp. HS19 TaxID=2692626 RepID=UPI00136E94F4|nr:regulatory protein RecX [Pseudomaricurvus sp. HS19]MYM65109.1 recombination regulator RecX [Pseudomaricurvus sp. HS19]
MTTEALNPEQLSRQLRWNAMELLARREHSRLELARKLRQRHADSDGQIEAVLDQLEADSLLSDTRFAEAYTSMRLRKGFGPARIEQELRERGVSAEHIRDTLASADVDWFEQSRLVLKKKFSRPPTDAAARAKCARYLQYRGFDYEQARYAIEGLAG